MDRFPGNATLTPSRSPRPPVRLRDSPRRHPGPLGWLPVTVEPRPDDTATTTWEQGYALVNGVPTVIADPDGRVAALYKDIARKVAITIAERQKDMSHKFPNIVVQNT